MKKSNNKQKVFPLKGKAISMKRFFVYSTLVILSTKAISQNSYLDYKYALKVYNQTSYENRTNYGLVDTLMPTQRNASSTLQYLHPTFAFQWKTKNQNFGEIEVINFYIKKITVSREQLDSMGRVEKVLSKKALSSSGISLRYEYTVNFNKLKTNKFVPSIGFAANPYFKLEQFIPEQSNAYKNSQSTIGASGFIIPRLTYYMNSRFFFDFNIPLCVMDLYYETNQHENPKIPVNQQKISNINFELFPKILSARIGLGFKL